MTDQPLPDGLPGAALSLHQNGPDPIVNLLNVLEHFSVAPVIDTEASEGEERMVMLLCNYDPDQQPRPLAVSLHAQLDQLVHVAVAHFNEVHYFGSADASEN